MITPTNSLLTTQTGENTPKAKVTQGQTGQGAQPQNRLSKKKAFRTQLKNDLGWIPNIVTGPFKGVGSLGRSVKRAQMQLRTKQQDMTNLQNQIEGHQESGEKIAGKIIKVRDKLLEKVDDERDKETIAKHFDQVLDNPSGTHTMPNVLRNLKRDPDNKELFTKLDTLKPQLQSQDKAIIDKQSELKKLRKLTEGTIVSKIIRTGLMGIASPFISLFSTTLVAPVLPLFGGMALLDANAVAQTGKHLDGRPCIREHLQKKMQGMEE